MDNGRLFCLGSVVKVLGETTGVYYVLFLFGALSFYTAFRIFQRQKALGNVKHKIGSKYQGYGILFPFFVVIGYSYLAYSGVLHSGVPYILEIVVWAALVILMILVSVYFYIKNGEVRESGINVGPNVLKWKEIKYFRVSDVNEFIIVLNNKSTFTKKYKEVRWVVQEEKVGELRKLLNQHVKEICSDSV